jgi:predicted nucleic acid-binding protein
MEWPDTHELLATIREAFAIVPVTVATHEAGIRLAERYRLSLYDSLLAGAARLAGCEIFCSQDMPAGLLIENQLGIVNPFRPT